MSKKPIEPKSANPHDLPFLHPESKKLEILHFKKRIMPDSWLEKITREGKTLPDYPAILILSDIVFRYMPETVELKDEFGEIIKKCLKNYFEGTRLERTYGYYEKEEHLSRAQAKRGMDNLIRLGLINLEIKDKVVRVGKKVKTFRNKLFIEPIVEKIAELTFGADAFKKIIESYQSIKSGSSQICQDKSADQAQTALKKEKSKNINKKRAVKPSTSQICQDSTSQICQDSTSQICEEYNNYTYKEKTTTNSKDKLQSFSLETKKPISKELIAELPEPYRVDKGVLKMLHEALNGELVVTIDKERKKIEAKDAPTLIKNIRYLKAIIEGGRTIGNYSGYLCTVIANEWEAKSVVFKTQAQKNEEERLAKNDTTTCELDKNERIVKAKNEADERLLIEIKALPSEELEALKAKVLELMPRFDKTRYSTATEFLKTAILERNMLRAYKSTDIPNAVECPLV